MVWVNALKESELAAGQAKNVTLEGKEIALYNVEGTFYATDNTCLHAAGPLGEGTLDKETITCPLHGWQYNVTTGKHAFSEQKLQTYEVKKENGEIQVNIE
jgi:nitrite reductase (NADH) small subunit